MAPYIIKWGQETLWLAIVAGLGALAGQLAGVDWSAFWADPKAVIVAAALVVGRVVGAVIWNQLSRLFPSGGSA